MQIKQVKGDVVSLAYNKGIAKADDPDPEGKAKFEGPAKIRGIK